MSSGPHGPIVLVLRTQYVPLVDGDPMVDWLWLVLGTMYPNYSSFSDNYLLSRLLSKVPEGTQIGEHMCGTCLLLPTQPCLLVANRHPQD